MKKSLLLLIGATFISGCQLSQSESMAKELAGRYPTAIYDVSKEFDATIPKDEKYNKPEIASVKAATRRYESEDQDKVFVDLRYLVTYKNGATLFCPLKYSWVKATRVVLLEAEGDCEKSGDPVAVEQPATETEKPAVEPPATAEAKKSPPQKETSEKSQTATANVEVTFLTDNPSAEVKEIKFLKNTDSYGEVQVKFKKTEKGKTLNCSNTYGFEYKEDRTFLLEVADCQP